MRELIAKARDFVARVYIPDLLAVASFYKDWAGYGGGVGNYLVYGEYPEDDGQARRSSSCPSGVIRGKDLVEGRALRSRRRSPSTSSTPGTTTPGGDEQGLHPSRARRSRTTRARAALRAARHRRQVQLAQVAALRRPADGGRPAVAHARGVRLGPPAGEGARRRRAPEARRRAGGALLDARPRGRARDRDPGPRREAWRAGSTSWRPTCGHDLRIHDNAKWDPSTWPKECAGAGFHEAPRGALGHWVHIKDGAIANYQCVVPSTWNAGPRDAAGKRGPYEEALARHAGRRRRAAARDPAHRPLVRPVHGVRRPRGGRPTRREIARGEGAMSATALDGMPVTSPPLTACHPGELVRVYVWEWPVRADPLAASPTRS